MSKSLGNYVGINEPAEQIFGKLMSVSDDLMWRYIELLSFEPMATVERWKAEVAQGRNPRDIKVGFAQEIVTRFHDRAAAERALADFEARFRQHELPKDMPEHIIELDSESIPLTQVLKRTGLTASTSEAMRMIDQGGVRLDGEKVNDKALGLPKGEVVVVQVGKRKFVRVTLADAPPKEPGGAGKPSPENP